MNETLKIIIDYLPAVISVLGSILAAVTVIVKTAKQLKKSDVEQVNSRLGGLYKALNKQIEQNNGLKNELESLRLEMRGIKPHEKKSKN